MARLYPVAASADIGALPDVPAIAVPAPPAPDDLDNTEEENYHLEVNAAETLGFPIATLSSTQSHAVLILGTSKYKDIIGPENHVFRFGVSIRALIVVSAAKVDFSLTLPIVAAKVQLGVAEASAELLVQGYKGSLGAELPKWQDFDVDSYAQYVKAVSDLQAKIMDDPANMMPELLATSNVSTAVQATVPSPAAAVGVVYALQAISHGVCLVHALDKLATKDPQARDAVRAVYADRVGVDDSSEPDKTLQQAAHDQLLAYHLEKDHFDLPWLR